MNYSFLFHKIAVMKSAFYILSALFFLSTCNTKDDYIQEVYVNINIDLNLPEYSDLQVSGNSIFIEGGVEGIIIYHGIGNHYEVYDRNCSYEPSLSCSFIDSIDAGIVYCGCCSSAFLLSNENEVFAKYWIHNGFITMSNEKMAKSHGNILKINDLKKNINGQVLRLALIRNLLESHHQAIIHLHAHLHDLNSHANVR